MNSDALRPVLPLPPPVRVRAPQASSAPRSADVAPPADGSGAVAEIAAQAQRARQAAVEVKRQLAEKDSQLTIDFDESLGRAIFKLVDTETGEVVRQIPSPEMLAIARAMAQQARSGVLIRTDA